MTSDSTKTYGWDARNHLASIGRGVTASFQYDPFGRRVSKSVGGSATSYLYDGANAVQELSGAAPTANLLNGALDEVLTRSVATGTSSYLADALGSTVALADNVGVIQSQYNYEPFGQTTVSGAVNTNPVQYTGRENDATGLYYYRARYYNPTMGRFMSEDPLGVGGGDAYLYLYAGNDPVDYQDPLGLWRLPDFVQANINIAIPNPWTFTLVGWSGTASIDRYGNWYWSPFGGGIGKSMFEGSFSLTANWLDRLGCTPTPEQLNNFLTSNGFNATLGYWGGVSQSYTPGAGYATGVGFVTPQAGVSYNYSFAGGKSGSGWSGPGGSGSGLSGRYDQNTCK